MKLFHADASPKGEISTSRLLAREFIAQLSVFIPALSVDYLDLSAEPPPHVTGIFARAVYTPEAERTSEGSPFAGMDALTPALRAAFGFLGADAPDFIDAQPMQFAMPEARAEGLARAREGIAAMAAVWARVPEPA
jgi:FMN-dependent NADH-azoreductase